MKNKKIIVSLILLLISCSLFAEKISLAPIITFDEKFNKIPSDKKLEKKLLNELGGYWLEGTVVFELLKASEYGEVYTVLDANKASESSGAVYLLYGYIQKNENSWFANLKLYSKNEKKIIREFFASDELNQYDRLVDDLANKIVKGINEISGFDISVKRQNEISDYKLTLPASVYFWSPIMPDWNKVLLGITGINIGLDFYPEQTVKVVDGYKYEWSIGLRLNYAFGIGKDNSYPLNYHVCGIYAPVLIHFQFNNKHSAFFGAGLFYEFEFINVIEKYKNQSFYYQNILGLELNAAYNYSINEKIDLHAGFDIDFHFNDYEFISLKPGLGVSIKM